MADSDEEEVVMLGVNADSDDDDLGKPSKYVVLLMELSNSCVLLDHRISFSFFSLYFYIAIFSWLESIKKIKEVQPDNHTIDNSYLGGNDIGLNDAASLNDASTDRWPPFYKCFFKRRIILCFCNLNAKI